MLEMNKIHCMDCLEGMEEIKDKSVDAIICDPPYYIGFKSAGNDGENRYDWGNHTMLIPLFDKLFSTFSRVLRDSGKLSIFTDWRTYPTLYLSITKFMNVTNLIVWDFDWIKAGTHFRFTHEFILYATMPKALPPKNRSISDVWRMKPINFTIKRNHPAEKPIAIIEKMLLETTKEGDLILDPFAGSGPVPRACKKLNRNFMAFEINPAHHQTALKLMENIPKRLDTFTKQEDYNE